MTTFLLALAGIMAVGCTPKGAATTTEQQEQQEVSATTNAVVETILSRRSIRQYTAEPVAEEQLQEILRCGINAPNGMYRQSWEVRVVRNAELLSEIEKGFEKQRARTGSKSKTRAFYGAPCLIFIAYDTTYDLSQVDCGLLGGNIITAAQSMGLGTCCLGQVTRFMTSDEAQPLYARLQLPDTHRLLYAIALGHPAEFPAAKPRTADKVRFID